MLSMSFMCFSCHFFDEILLVVVLKFSCYQEVILRFFGGSSVNSCRVHVGLILQYLICRDDVDELKFQITHLQMYHIFAVVLSASALYCLAFFNFQLNFCCICPNNNYIADFLHFFKFYLTALFC